ncbi:DUF86 domain-containing protein [Candidatus Roizmanbacteria bacterium]|nr:DUF86 domain-containing protein [Candidatus Roizmanbacteria bacterium]
MPIDKNLVKEKLQKIDEYLKRIEAMSFSEDQFLENVDYQDLLTFRLQQAIEISIEIATHIISSLELEKPQTARSSFEVLSKYKIISDELAKKMMLAVSFRNIVVHKYEDFDFSQVFRDYKEDIECMKNFIGEIMKYLG